MKLVIVGGSGHIGQSLRHHWREHDITIISRSEGIPWDGRTLGPWARSLEGVDAVINLAGRSVNCRYTPNNLKEMRDSRVESTAVLGQAIAQCQSPPRVWLQSSTATIYAHTYDVANDEANGVLGGSEPGAPQTWRDSIDIAKAWESAFDAAQTPETRKVAMRSAMVMSPVAGSVFSVLASLSKQGLGGTQGHGRHYVSWVHESDFCRALDLLIEREGLSGPINICSPNPIAQEAFARILRHILGVRFAPRLPGWLLEIGAWVRRTETELILKSRRVVPARLLESGFQFRYPNWPEAAADLVRRLNG